MAELVKCTRCRNIMPDEDYDEHRCEPRRRNFRVIKFTSFHVIDGFDGRKILDINALNGDNYVFEEVLEDKEQTKIPYQTPQVNTENFDDKTPSSKRKLMTVSVKKELFYLFFNLMWFYGEKAPKTMKTIAIVNVPKMDPNTIVKTLFLLMIIFQFVGILLILLC